MALKICLCLLALFFISACEGACTDFEDCSTCNADTSCIWCANDADDTAQCNNMTNCDLENDGIFICGAGSECPTDYNCQIYKGLNQPLIDVFSRQPTATIQVCSAVVNSWFKVGDYIWADSETDIYDFSGYTGDPSDVYELAYDEIDIVDLQDVMNDTEVGGSVDCLNHLSQLYCALAWGRCNQGKNCFDFIDQSWCMQQKSFCNIDNSKVADYYGEDYLDLLLEFDCSNTSYFRTSNSTNSTSGKRQDRQLRRDFTPPPTTATPTDQCDLPKTTQKATKTAPAAKTTHPCPGTKSGAESQFTTKSWSFLLHNILTITAVRGLMEAFM